MAARRILSLRAANIPRAPLTRELSQQRFRPCPNAFPRNNEQHPKTLNTLAESSIPSVEDSTLKTLKQMMDKVLRSYAEVENVIQSTRRESENSNKFAIQNFAKGLLDVADNLGRASSVTKESFSKLDASKDTTGAVQQLLKHPLKALR